MKYVGYTTLAMYVLRSLYRQLPHFHDFIFSLNAYRDGASLIYVGTKFHDWGKNSYRESHMILQSPGLVSWLGKWITMYRHMQKTYERLQPLKLRNLTLVTSQIGKTISPLSQDLWSLNLLFLVFMYVNLFWHFHLYKVVPWNAKIY